MIDNQNEAKWINAAINGDLDAFNRLVLAYQTVVYNTALRIMNNEASADDVAQNAFLSAWNHIDSFKTGSFKPWIIRITINACYDEIRKQKRRPTIPLEPISPDTDDEIEDADWMVDPNKNTVDEIEQKELMQIVESCLEALTDEYRIVLTLVDVDEISYQDVSDIIHKPLGTVKSRLLRARLRMKNCITSKGGKDI